MPFLYYQSSQSTHLLNPSGAHKTANVCQHQGCPRACRLVDTHQEQPRMQLVLLQHRGLPAALGPGTASMRGEGEAGGSEEKLSLIHSSEPTRLRRISYVVFGLHKKKNMYND